MSEEVQTQKKDKQKVLDEVFTEAMLQSFLMKPVPSQDSDDFRRLLFAYRGMPVEAFEAFLMLFEAAGHNLNAKDHQNRTFLEYIERFKSHAPYAEVLRKRLQ